MQYLKAIIANNFQQSQKHSRAINMMSHSVYNAQKMEHWADMS